MHSAIQLKQYHLDGDESLKLSCCCSVWAQTILENYFGWWSPMREGNLPMQLECTRSCYPLVGSRCSILVKSIKYILSIFKASWWKFLDFCIYLSYIIYKEFIFLVHTYVYKFLFWTPILHAPKINQTMSNLL